MLIFLFVITVLAGISDVASLNITTFSGQTYQIQSTAGTLLCFVTDVDCQLNGRLSATSGDKTTHLGETYLSEIGIRVASDKIIVSSHPSQTILSAKLHDEEIPRTLTVKLAGGSLRRHHQKIVIKLKYYNFKIGVRDRGRLFLEAMYRPNNESLTDGLLSNVVSMTTDYRITDGDLSSLNFPKNNFTVTDLWKQDYKMYRSTDLRSKQSGWQISGFIE